MKKKNKNREDFYKNYVSDDLEIILPKESIDTIINSELGLQSLYYKILGILKDNTYEISDELKAHAEVLFNSLRDEDLKKKWYSRVRRNTESSKIIGENIDFIKTAEDLFGIYEKLSIFATIDDCEYDIKKYKHPFELADKINQLLNTI